MGTMNACLKIHLGASEDQPVAKMVKRKAVEIAGGQRISKQASIAAVKSIIAEYEAENESINAQLRALLEGKIPLNPPLPKGEEAKGFGAGNTLFTEDKAAKARAILKAKLSGTQLNVGIDPDILTAGIDLAGYYIEGGARKFGDFSAKMVADIGEAIRPYLKSLYLAVRNYPGFDKTGMETEAQLEDAEENRLTAAAPAGKIPAQGGKTDADQTDVQSGRTSDDDQTPAATGEEGQNAGGLPEDLQPVISQLEGQVNQEGSEIPEGLDLRAEIEAHVEQYLYHATYEDKIAGINADGLDPAKSGQYIYGNDTTRRVYLSPDQDLALNFGDVLLRVKRDRLTATMLKDIERAGGKEVWYFDRIPPALIEHLTPKGEWAPFAAPDAIDWSLVNNAVELYDAVHGPVVDARKIDRLNNLVKIMSPATRAQYEKETTGKLSPAASKIPAGVQATTGIKPQAKEKTDAGEMALTGNLRKLERQNWAHGSARWEDKENRIDYELNAPEISANPSPYWEGGIRHKGWAQEAKKFKTRDEAIRWLDDYDTSKIDKDSWGPGAQFIDEMFGKGTYEKVKEDVTPDNESKIKAAISDAKKNGPSNEFRALFGGIDPVKAGTTNDAVAKLAKELGLRWNAPPVNVAKDQTEKAAAPSKIPAGVQATTGIKPQAKEDPYRAAVGLITGERADRAVARGYVFAYGPADAATQSEMVGIFSGLAADKLVEAGITIERKTPAAFKKGDRVVMKNGRHGEIIADESYTTITATIFGGQRNVERYENYRVRSDAGSEYSMIKPEDLTPETEKPAGPVIPDIREPNGVFEPPDRVLYHIALSRRDEKRERATAQRARKTANIQAALTAAEKEKAKGDELQRLYDAWAAQYPDEAAKHAPAKTPPPASVSATTGLPAASPSPQPSPVKGEGGSTLAAYGLSVAKGSTNTGKTVWNVSGPETRTWKDTIKQAGGRWYGPKKVWSFYNGDPTQALLSALPPIDQVHPSIREKYAAKTKTPAPPPAVENTPTANEKLAAKLSALRNDLDRKGAGNSGNVSYKIVAADTGLINDYGYERTENGTRTAHNGAGKMHWERARAIDEAVADAQRHLTGQEESEPETRPALPGPTLKQDLSDRTLAASLKYLNPEVNDDRNMLILLADKAEGKLGEIINEYLDNGRQMTPDEVDFINDFDKDNIAKQVLKRAYDEGFIARPKAIDNEKTNDYNKIEEEAQHAASDRHDPDEIPAANDRAGDQRPGPADVSGTEAVGPADGVRPGTERSDDGHVRHTGIRTEQGPVRHESDLSGASPAPDFRAQPGVGRDDGDVAGVQRSATGERTDHVIAPGAIERTGSWFSTAQTNLDIIELAKKIQTENRAATPAEQALMARYTGFGASEIANRMFPGWAQSGKINMYAVEPRWKPLVERMQAVLTPEEIATAARSTQYAHYTSPAIIESIYKAIAGFGFTGGRILEPGMGVGSFFGLMPASMRTSTKYTGVEMDGITAQIAKLLYPRQNIIEGDYTKSKFPNNYFDLSVGNPPFARIMILTDPDYKKLRLKLHDFFFVKTLDKIRPGGLMVFITSRYTMDKVDSRVRKILNDQADLLGAIRLPQTAFQHNAGTEVVTDVLFLRKKVPGEQSAGMMWGEVSPVATPEGDFRINEYYLAHPEMVLGNHSGRGKMQNTRDPQYTVLPGAGNIEEAFAAAAANLPKNVYSLTKAAPVTQAAAAIEKDFNPKNKKEGGLYLSPNGQVMVTESGAGVPVAAIAPKLTDKDKRWLTSYIALRDAVKQCQYDQLTDGDWEASLKELTRVYRAFKMAWGRINAFTVTERKDTDEDGNPVTTQSRKFANSRLLRLDVESPLVMALEKVGEDGQITDAPFLTERTIKKPESPQIHTAADALAVSLNEKGKLDLTHVASLLGASEADIYEQLGDLVYDTPDKGIITADEYLSGNVVQKLAEAEAAAAIDPKYERNVQALIAAQPKPLTARDITASPGASWIPLPVYNDFAHEVLDLPDFAEVEHSPADNQWTLSGISAQSQRGRASEWCTPDRGANEIFTAVLNNATQKVYKTEIVNGDKKTFLDPAATAQVNDIAKKMKARFRNWIWENAGRAHEVLEVYNTTRNNIVPRRFDGSHLTLPGVSLRFKLMPHQKNAIWRIIQDGNTYIAHAVGAGKTYEMVAAGMEMKRLGLINKPLYVVPNHMLRQFSNEFQELYPMAHIMVADEENFHTTNRRRFMAQAALNAPDAIVITHSAFGLLKMKPENIKPVRDAVINEMREALDDLEGDKRANRIRIKQMEARIEQTEQRFDAMIAQGDNVLTFEDMGADFLFVDEAHQFRKLDFTTNRQAKGVDPTGSVRAMTLYIKTQWLNQQNPGRSHVFASGTPVTNTMGELYTIMKFFDLAGLQHDGMEFYDSWATEYGDMASVPEMNAAGRYEIVDRFSRFVNVPELMSRVRSFMDVLTSSQLGAFVNRPKVQGGQPTIVVTPPSDALKNYQKNILLPRIETSKAWKPSPTERGNPDPLINIITDGRLASIDMRFVQPQSDNDPDSKLNQYIDKIIAVYKDTKDNAYRDPATGQDSPVKGGAQICFYNHGFGKGVAARRGFDARAWAMQRFKEAGIPAHEIAWIDDYDTAAKKEAMMKEVRNGHKRILIGSAKKMGTGMNVQTRLSHMTYLDPPWYPSDVEQPVGRILRQGNQNKEVGIYYFSTKGSYDATMWQMVTRKAKFIEDALAGGGARAIEDISESSLYEMAAALASGDERAIRMAGLNNEIENLRNLRSAHYATQTSLQHEKRMYKIGYPGKKAHVANLEAATEKVPFDLRYLSGHSPIEAKIDARSYTDRKAFGQDLLAKIVALRNAGAEGKTTVGSFFGLPLRVVQVMGGKQDVWSREEQDQQVIWVKESQDGKLVNQLQLVVTDNVIYDVATDITDTSDAPGLVTRITNRAKAVASDLAQAKQSLEETETELKKINARLGAPFEMERELEEKIAEAAQINADLTREGLATTTAQQQQHTAPAQTPDQTPPDTSGPMLSLSVEEDDASVFSEKLDDYRHGKIKARSIVTVGKTPYVLEKLGAQPLPLVITKETIDKVTTGKHGLSLDTLQELPAHLADPIMVFDSATQTESLVVMTELKQDGKTVVAAIHLSKEQGRNVVNDIASVHPRQSEFHFINWINQGLLRYMNKKKSRAWSVTSGLQLPTVRGSIPGSDKKILFDYDLVKREDDAMLSADDNRSTEAEELDSGFRRNEIEQQTAGPKLDDPGLNEMVRDLATRLKGITIIERNGEVWIKTPSGDEVRIKSAEAIDPNGVALTIEQHYSKEKLAGKRIAGMFTSKSGEKTIHLVRDVAGIWTLSHEFFHFLENINAITNSDKELLNRKIAYLVKTQPDAFGHLASRSLPEQRAEYVGRALVGTYDAVTPVGKILARIREMIDRVLNALGIRTAPGVIRDIQTGKIYKKQAQRFAGSTVQPGRDSRQGIDNVRERAYTYPQQGDQDETSSVSDPGRETDGRNAGGTAAVFTPTVVGREKIGSVPALGRVIRRAQDAAQIASQYLAKYPDEHLISIVLDKKGKVLHIYRHTIGLPGSSQASPPVIAGEALNTPGAAAIIVAHNHPSGEPRFSPEDQAFSRRMENLLSGSGITLTDSLTVALDKYASYAEDQGGYSGPVNPSVTGKTKIPVLGRVFEQTARGNQVSSPAHVLPIVNRLIPGGGTLFLSGANEVSGYSQISDYSKIRGPVQREWLSDAEKRNARAMIVYAPHRLVPAAEAENLAKLLAASQHEIKLLDIIDASGSHADQGTMPAKFAGFDGANFLSLESAHRTHKIPAAVGEILTSYFNINQVKAHPDYAAAKAGDKPSAARLVKSLVKEETISAAKDRFGEGVLYAYPHALEASGTNMIPAALANYYAQKTGGKIAAPIVQTTRAFHTGANAMERLISRPSFDGQVLSGGKYVLVDDATTLGGTFAELSHYIQSKGGQVVGIVSLTNASRMRNIIPTPAVIREIERRFGHDIRELFGIDPAALTAAEAGYLSGFRDADTLRNRAAKAIRERRERLLSKGIRTDEKPVTYLSLEDVTQNVTQAAGKRASRAVDIALGRVSPEKRETLRHLKKAWNEFWRPFSTVKDGDAILSRRYESMGNVAKAVRFIEAMKTELDKYPPETKKDIFWYLNGDLPLNVLPEDARDTAKNLQRRTEIIGEMLVDRGILTQETFDAHKGQYVHYLYAKHIVGEDAPVGITSSGKLDLSYTLQRNPHLTMQQRKELGLIDDASVAVPVGMGKALTDIAKFDYLDTIADNPDWVWQPSVVRVAVGKKLATPIMGRTRRYVKMGIGKLKEQVATYDEMMRARPTPEVAEIHKILTQAWQKEQAKTQNAPADFVQLPNTRGYGPLAGAFVKKPIADDLRPVMDVNTDRGKLLNTVVEIERTGMAAFKMGKVALNIPTACRNIVSNIIQNNMRGRALAKIPGDIVAACESMKAKDQYYDEAFGMGLFHTNWFVTEINDVLAEFRKAESGRIDKILTAVKNVAKYYGKIDDISKFAIYRQMRVSGAPVDKATLEAMKWGMDYSLTSRSIKGLRQTIMPFATYQYKIAPLIAESLKKRPWVLAKFALIYPAARMLAMALHDLDDDDWEDLEKQLPAYIKKSGSMMILPWKSDKDQWQWVNLEYYFPFGNMLAIFRDAKELDSGEALRDLGISNPFLSMFYTGISTREDAPPLSSYSGFPIYNQLDPAPMKAAKYLEHMVNTWMPGMLTRQGALGYTGKALIGGEDRWGREVSFGQALGRWFGFNMVSVSPEQTRAQASVKIADLRKEMARIDADPSRSEENKEAYRDRMNTRLADLAEQSPASILPITKAKGADPVYEALKDMAAQGILRSGPPSRVVEVGGVPLQMTLPQYREYLDRSSEIARRKLSALVDTPAWDTMPDRRKTEVVSGIVANARKAVRQQIKAQMARDNREKILAARAGR